jgi:hypothetical protein
VSARRHRSWWIKLYRCTVWYRSRNAPLAKALQYQGSFVDAKLRIWVRSHTEWKTSFLFRSSASPVADRYSTLIIVLPLLMVRFSISSVVILIGSILGNQLVNAAFSIYDESSVLDVSLGDACIAALTASVDCTPYVQQFQQLSYRGDLDLALTDSICTSDCLSSLKSWFDSVSLSCVGKSVSGGIPTRYGGYMWAGYNETCVKDPRPPRAYCNSTSAIISTFRL